MFLKFLKVLGFFVVVIILLASGIVYFFYATAPRYNFSEPAPFSGPKFYNPYQDIDSTFWRKANFHLQSRAWWGLTDGRINRPELVYETYTQLGYDIIIISDYMKINRYGAEKKGYIPVYEHGYGIFKTHQLCLGAKQVDWRDYPLFQDKHHKQHIIEILSRTNKLLAINHPRVRNGYTLEDMKWLSGYDLIEAASNYVISLDYWDMALSHGYPVFIISNDDSHNVLKPSRVGKFCTFVNTSSLHEDSIIDALKRGKAYGVQVNMREGDGFPEKIETHRNLPHLLAMNVVEDTLYVKVSKNARAFVFSSDFGLIRKISYNNSSAFYPIESTDSYVRTTVIFDDNTRFYLNPIIRSDGTYPHKPPIPQINKQKTILTNVTTSIIGIILFGLMFRILKVYLLPSRKRRNFRRL